MFSAKEGAMAVLASVAVGDTDTATSSLTPSPGNRKRKKVTPSVDSSALLKTIDEGGALHSQSEKTNKLVEAAVQDGVKFFFSSSSSKSSKKSSTSSSQSDRAPKRTSAQASYHRSFMLKHKQNVDVRYSKALKEATSKYMEGGISFVKVCNEFNKKYDLPNERKLNKTTLRNYIASKRVGVSPLKKGPKPTLPPKFLDLLSCHISMRQLSGEGECKPKDLKGIIGAAIANTPLEDELSSEYVYKKLMEKFPNTVRQSKAMKVEDRRSNWTTYPNINLWFDGAKESLLRYGYAEEGEQLVKDIFKGTQPPCDIPGKYYFINNVVQKNSHRL